MVQLRSSLTLACSEHACVLQFLLSDSVKARVRHEMDCTRVYFCILHSSYRIFHTLQASNTLCAAHKSVFLCAACNNSSPLSEKDQGIQQNSMLVNMIKHVYTNSVKYMYPYSSPLWMTLHWTNWMPNTIIAESLDSTSLIILYTSLVTQCARVLYHKGT